MSANYASLYAQQYATRVVLLLQYKGSKLRGKMTEAPYMGKGAQVIDQMGAVEMQQVTGRFEPMGRVDAPFDSRWVYPTSWDLPQMIDHFDKLKALADPESQYLTNAVMAAGRKIDTIALQAMTADAKTGVEGGTTTSYTSGNTITVSAAGGTNSRINIAKLLALREIAVANHIDLDEEPLNVILTAKDQTALFNEIQMTSRDFTDKPILQDGRITSFLGFNFIQCELAETVCAGTNKVTLPVWTQNGMHLGFWEDVKTDVSQVKTIKGLPWQVYLYMTFGATRIDEKRVFGIESYRA